MKVKLVISYDGTDYSGWQVQPNKNTIQGQLESAIFSLTGEKVRVTGSGRTDAGVHAERQVACFNVKTESIPAEKYYLALNTILPPDVKVIESSLIEEDIHPVKCAKKKTYVYSFYLSNVELPLKERYAVKISQDLNLSEMQAAARLIEGEHDFKAFCSSGSSVLTTVREIYSVKIEKVENDLKIYVTGNGFLYNMVRIICGTLLKIGEGKLDKNVILEMFKNLKRERGGRTLPAKALKLLNVEYR